MQRAIPILMYHRIRDTLRDSRDVSRATFERHMAYLRRSGWTSLGADELVGVLEGTLQRPRRAVVVTFDDGTEDLFWAAYPILARHGIRGVAFVPTGWIEGARPGHLTWRQAEELASSGIVEVQSHTHRHRRDNLELVAAGRIEEIREDLVRSRELLESRLGARCRHLAWPQGHWNHSLLRLALEAGFVATYAADPAPNTLAALPVLGRFKVKERPVRWLAARLLIYSWAPAAAVYAAVRGRPRKGRPRRPRGGLGRGGGPRV